MRKRLPMETNAMNEVVAMFLKFDGDMRVLCAILRPYAINS